MPFDKVRIRFRKDGDLRLLSHHDLMRAFERLLRRAALPFRSTEGFHPTPRMIFALALPLGMTGAAEVVELEFTEPIEPESVLLSLRCHAPQGLSFDQIKRIDLRQSASPRRALYRLSLPSTIPADLLTKLDDFLNAPEVWVEREKPRRRRINIRPYVHTLAIRPPTPSNDLSAEASDDRGVPPPKVLDGESSHLEMDCWVTGAGTTRADELIRLLGLGSLLDHEGRVIERTFLELADEIDPSTAPPSPNLERPTELPSELPEPTPETTSPRRGALPHEPVVE